MTSHRGRRRIPRPSLPKPALVKPALAAGALTTVVAGCVIGVTVTRHDPVTIIPVGSISPLPAPPSPTVSPLTGVGTVSVCWLGSPAVADHCVDQDPQDVVDETAVRR